MSIAVRRQTLAPQAVLPPHTHAAPMLAVVLRGAAELRLPGRAFGLGAGALYTRSEERHALRVGPVGAELVVLDLDAEPQAAPVLRSPRLSAIARRLEGALRARDALRALSVEGLAQEAVAEIVAAGTVSRTAAWLRRVDELLDARFLEPLRLEDVARVAGVHPMQVARTFRAAHGESVAASLRRRRVLWAAERIAAGREPLSAIALEAGFCDQAHFCRIFRKVTGRTPGSFRRRFQL
ncbi:MAG TPA: AraC family transcriptional regulator [Myxococcales bacterium]|nr:AraC family transcriptional regulator [Myxococcales bacterium]